MFLEQHQGVKRVLYPGLPSHPQHELAKEQQHGFGAMITFYCIGKREQAAIVLKKVRMKECESIKRFHYRSKIHFDTISIQLKIFALAESLGAVESLAECPSLMTHASVPDEERAKLKIRDTLIRLSIGIESCADLIGDLDNALNAAVDTM